MNSKKAKKIRKQFGGDKAIKNDSILKYNYRLAKRGKI